MIEEKFSVLFLDLDGVITTPATNWRDFDLECVKNLKYIIKETNCKIVVHSTWRNHPENRKRFFYLWGRHGFDLETFLDFAPNSVGPRQQSFVSAKTFDIFLTSDKKSCIENWLENNNYRVDSVCILDDEDYNFDPIIYVKPNGYIGLSFENALEVIKILNKE